MYHSYLNGEETSNEELSEPAAEDNEEELDKTEEASSEEKDELQSDKEEESKEEPSELKEEVTDIEEPSEEIINNEEDLTEEDKAMYEGYLDKVDSHSEEDLSEEEKAMYHSYLNGEETSNEEVSKPVEDDNEEEESVSDYDNEVSEQELEDLVYINNVHIDEIKDSDLSALENIMSGNNGNEDDGIELMHISNNDKVIENNNDENNNTKTKSLESFDSMDELLNKETNMSEERELDTTIEKEGLDNNTEVDEEFTLGDDNEPILIEKEEHEASNDDEEDFDGEITQSDLDYAIKLFESEEESGSVNEYSSKPDVLLSENEINKFKKLFGYFKNIVEKMSPEDLNDFSKTEFYDMYSSLFRKFGE